MVGDALETFAPPRVDSCIGRVSTFVRQPGAYEALPRLCGSSRDCLEVFAPTHDAFGFEAFPYDVAVLLRLTANLVEDRINVEKLKGRLASALEGCVEALVDGAVEPGVLPPNGEHVDAHDEEACLLQPGLMVGGVASLALLRVAVRVEQRAKLLPRRLCALEEQRKHCHEVRLAAAKAAVDEAPVLFAAIEDLLHIVENAGKLLLDRRRDDVVVDELLDLVGRRIGLAELHDEAHRPNIFGARKLENLGDGGHVYAPTSQPSSSSRFAAR